MEFKGLWVFHSIGVINDDGEMQYMSAEEYMNSPMLYIDETDEEAVEDEIKSRKQTIGSCIEVCDDGKLYMLMPLPEGVSQKEIDEAVAAGAITLRCGMLCDAPMSWEERDGKLWLDTGIEGEVFGEKADTWACAVGDSGLFEFMTTRYVKEEK